MEEVETLMIRTRFGYKDYHRNLCEGGNITVLICQRQTKDLIELCLESLLRFYPDIPILVVDGDSNDSSSIYLAWIQVKHPNIRVWTKTDGYHSHGITMDYALRYHIKTKYVLILDSDVIINRGWFIEEMLGEITVPVVHTPQFGIGSLMLVSKKNQGCGPAADENDVLRYLHPSCSLIDREMYMELRPFTDHGAPCWNTMAHAEMKGWVVLPFEVDHYVSHLSGASWTNPRTVWPHDNGVMTNPFLSIIMNYTQDAVISVSPNQKYEILFSQKMEEGKHVVIHGSAPTMVKNDVYPLRFLVKGDYVCDTTKLYGSGTDFNTDQIMHEATIKNAPDEFIHNNLTFVRRDVWQEFNCFYL